MSLPIYQFQFIDPISGEYYYLDGHDVKLKPAVENVGSLVDWKTLQVQWKRHSKYQGVFRKYMPDTVSFALDAAKILRFVFNTKGGSEAKLILVINKLKTTDQQYYLLASVGVDFSKYNSQQWYVDVRLMEADITKLLNAYDTSNYSLQIGEPQVVWGATPTGPIGPPVDIVMSGFPFIETYNYLTNSPANPDGGGHDWQAPFGASSDSALGVIYVNQNDYYFKTQGTFSAGTAQSVGCDANYTTGLTGSIATNANVFAGKTVTDLISISGSLNITSISAPGTNSGNDIFNIYAKIYDADATTVIATQILWSSPPIAPGATFAPGVIPLSYNFIGATVHAGWFLIIGANLTAVGGSVGLAVVLDPEPTQIAISINCYAPWSLCAALSGWQVFQMLIDNLLMTNPAIPGNVWPLPLTTLPGPPPPWGYDSLPAPPCKSDLLTTPANNWDVDPTQLYYTSGNALRNAQYLPENSPVAAYINTTIADFIQDQFVTHAAGFGIENIAGIDTFVIEELSHFYQAGVKIADLGNKIKNFSITPYTDYLGNNIKFGYKDQNYNDANGNWEFNKETDYSTLVMNTQQDIDYTSPYRADPYGIEGERISSAGASFTTVASDILAMAASDTDLFKIQSDGTDAGLTFGTLYPYSTDPTITGLPCPAKQLKKNNGVTGNGLPQATFADGVANSIFNIPLSTGRQRNRLMKWLKSVYYGLPQPDQQLTFKKSTRPLNLESSMIGGAGLVEEFFSPIDLTSTGGDIYFKPFVLNFTAEVPLDLDDLMGATPYGVFGLTAVDDYGTEFYLEGFTLEAGMTPGTNDSFDFKLLCSPNTTIPPTL